MLKKIAIAAGGLIVVVVVAGFVIPMVIWPNINDVETGQTPEYPDIQPRHYEIGAQDVGDASVETVDDLRLWELESDEEAPERIEAIRETRLFGFVDDVTIRIDEDDGVSQVDVRSRSRTGEFDYGQNARNIGELFDGLDDRIGDERLDEQTADN